MKLFPVGNVAAIAVIEHCSIHYLSVAFAFETGRVALNVFVVRAAFAAQTY